MSHGIHEPLQAQRTQRNEGLRDILRKSCLGVGSIIPTQVTSLLSPICLLSVRYFLKIFSHKLGFFHEHFIKSLSKRSCF